MNQFEKSFVKHNTLNDKYAKKCFVLLTLSFCIVTAAIIFTTSMINAMTDKLVCLSSGHLEVFEDKSKLDLLENNNMLVSDNVIKGNAVIYSQNNNFPITIKGVEQDYFDKRKSSFTECNINNQSNGVILSRTIAENLNVKIGDSVALMIIYQVGNVTVRPDITVVKGIYDSGYNEIDKNLIFVDYLYALNLFSDANSHSTEIILKDYSYQNLQNLQESLSSFNYINWMNANESLYTGFELSRQSILLILFMIVMVSCYFTALTSQQMIFDQRNQIALFKLMGAKNRSLFKIQTYSILSMVIVSSVFGFVLGLVLGVNLSKILVLFFGKQSFVKQYLLTFDAQVPAFTLLMLFFAQLVITLMFSVISLFKTKSIQPIQLFRNN